MMKTRFTFFVAALALGVVAPVSSTLAFTRDVPVAQDRPAPASGDRTTGSVGRRRGGAGHRMVCSEFGQRRQCEPADPVREAIWPDHRRKPLLSPSLNRSLTMKLFSYAMIGAFIGGLVATAVGAIGVLMAL